MKTRLFISTLIIIFFGLLALGSIDSEKNKDDEYLTHTCCHCSGAGKVVGPSSTGMIQCPVCKGDRKLNDGKYDYYCK